MVDAAVTMLKHAFSWPGMDLAGMSGGGHLVACLIARRSDVGCAVIASGNVAVRQRNTEQLRLADVTGFMDFLDPIELVSEVARHPPQSMIVLTDKQDRVVSLACQQTYVEALINGGVRVDHRMLQPSTATTIFYETRPCLLHAHGRDRLPIKASRRFASLTIYPGELARSDRCQPTFWEYHLSRRPEPDVATEFSIDHILPWLTI